MGAITISRKRTEEWFSVNRTHSSPNSSDSRISKRARFSSMPQTSRGPVLSSNTTVSRLSRYPEAKPQLTREVHAPTRTDKFGFWPISTRVSSSRTSGNFEKEETGSHMGNLISFYKNAKASALDTLRHSDKGKKVLEVDIFSQKIAVSEDSSLEEVEIIKHGRQSVVTEQTRRGSADDVVEIHGLDAKARDGGLQHQQSTSSAVTELNYDILKGEAENLFDSLSLESEASGKHRYERLLAAVNSPSRTDTFKRLNHDIELYEEKKRHFDLLRDLRPKKEPTEDIPREPFVPLTEEEEAEVTNAFSASRKEVLVSHENSNIEITVEIFQCLKPGAWLNDEVINVYFELLKEREKREPDRFLKCHFFNTFFYKKLISGKNAYDFKSVRRWTSQRKLGYRLIECDKIFVPIHKGNHWCLAIINKRDKKFQYLDSLRGRDNRVLKVLARYFADEVNDKSGEDIDVTSWKKEFVEDLPEQENGSDCGMFMLKYIDFYSRGLGLCFNQKHMPYFRQRTAKEILRLKAD